MQLVFLDTDLGVFMEYLPFIIPFLLIEYGLLAAALVHIFRHKHYKCGNRVLWAIITIALSGVLIGPILYFALGKEEE